MGAITHPTDLDPAAVVGLATCHSAEKCGDVIVASEVEFKMFQATGWRFTSPDGAVPVVLESSDGSSHIVLQRNEFCHTRMTQSVVVKGPEGVHEIFVKVRRERGAAAATPETAATPHFFESAPAAPTALNPLPHSPSIHRARSKPSARCARRPPCRPTLPAWRGSTHWKGATCWLWPSVC